MSFHVTLRNTDNTPNLMMSMSLNAQAGNLLSFLHFVDKEYQDDISTRAEQVAGLGQKAIRYTYHASCHMFSEFVDAVL